MIQLVDAADCIELIATAIMCNVYTTTDIYYIFDLFCKYSHLNPIEIHCYNITCYTQVENQNYADLFLICHWYRYISILISYIYID